MRRRTTFLVTLALALALGTAALAQEPDPVPAVRAYTHAKLLKPGAPLRDGEVGAKIAVTNATLLIWVDLAPGYRFVHPSRYVLIAADGIRVIEGDWWPTLAGASIFGTPPWFPETEALVRFPISVPDITDLLSSKKHAKATAKKAAPSLDSVSATDSLAERWVDVYAFPFTLRPGDVLTEAGWIFSYEVPGQTMLVWVDRNPRAKFAHPTAYVLIGPDDVQVLKGLWWPELDGRRILYGEPNDWGTRTPFDLY